MARQDGMRRRELIFLHSVSADGCRRLAARRSAHEWAHELHHQRTVTRGRQVAPLLHGTCEPKSTAAGVNEAQCLLQLLVHLVALL
jgi:hypothetical protein